jgi:IS30 family transposase
MPRGKHLSEIEKGQILAYHSSNCSIREIGRRINRSHNVILNFLAEPDSYGKFKTGGPKKKLSDRDERRVVQAASNSLKSLKQIKSECQVDVSRSTLHRVLKRNTNIVRQKLLSAPRLLERHKAARLEFARANMHRDWHKVDFYSIIRNVNA